MSQVKRYFNAVAENYNDKSSKGIWELLRNLESTAVIKAMNSIQGKKCLELGCGAGFYTKILAKGNPSLLVAVDISENMLNELNIPGVKRIRADIENIKFKVKFDRVFCAGAIEFLPDIKIFISNLKSILSVSGKAVLLLPKKGLFGWIYRVFHRSHSIQVAIYSCEEIKSILVSNNLKIESQYSPTPMTRVLVISPN